MIESAVGFSIDAPTAWTARNATSAPRVGATLHRSDPAVNTAMPTWNVRRRPSRSAVAPAAMSRLATTSV